MEKSTIQERHDQLDQEILSFAKNENYALMKQKVDLQKKLSQILEKGKQEEMVFDEKNLLDDQLYVKAKEVGDQKLLDKFHNRSLTRKEYVKTCKDLDIDYELITITFLVRFDKVGCLMNMVSLCKNWNKYGLINKNPKRLSNVVIVFIFENLMNMVLHHFAFLWFSSKTIYQYPMRKVSKHPFTKKKW